jgi:hypothetical protein
MWCLKCGDFDEDFVGHNLDDYQEFLSLCELEDDQLFCRCKRRSVDARYNNFIGFIGSKITDIVWDHRK